MEKFFAIVGKVLLGGILLAIVLTAGYFIGSSKYKSETTPLPSPTSSVIQVNSTEIKPTVITTPTDAPTPSASATKTISAGLSSGTSFKKYSLQVSSGWSDKKDDTPGVIDKLILTKGDYSLTITQAAMGGGGCLYKGDADQMMAQKFTNYEQIGDYRRSWNDEGKSTTSYTICQKGSDGSYGSPTKFGAINATAPASADATTLKEMDSIVTSITTQ